MNHPPILFTLLRDHVEFEPIHDHYMPSTVSYGTHLTPFGPCFIVHDQNIIVHLSFCEPSAENDHLQNIQKYFSQSTLEKDEESVQQLCSQIFSHHEHNLPLRGRLDGSAFQIHVWKQLLHISRGTTVSYQHIAQQLQLPRATRAVASAIARNNIAYLVPCHRVIGMDGKLRGYRWGVDRKKLILEHEKAIL
jgi:AraC family transcriptional regulator of adaptative response/methylated-DNA-[protein]-cysteine methyltransferase